MPGTKNHSGGPREGAGRLAVWPTLNADLSLLGLSQIEIDWVAVEFDASICAGKKSLAELLSAALAYSAQPEVIAARLEAEREWAESSIKGLSLGSLLGAKP